MFGLAQYYLESCWEVLKKHDTADRTMPEAIADQMGHCGHRSRFIGAMALSDGIPAFRALHFEQETEVVMHHASYLFLEGRWVRISTLAGLRSSTVSVTDLKLSASQSYVQNSAGNVTPVSRRTLFGDKLYIPENVMPAFAECETLDDYLTVLTSENL